MSLEKDKEEYSLSKEKYRAAEEKINDFLNKLLGIETQESDEKEEKQEEIEISEERNKYLVDSSNSEKPVIKGKSNEEREHYESYTYEDNDGLVCISVDGDCLIIANEEDEILFDKKYIDQIIEFLSRL